MRFLIFLRIEMIPGSFVKKIWNWVTSFVYTPESFDSYLIKSWINSQIFNKNPEILTLAVAMKCSCCEFHFHLKCYFKLNEWHEDITWNQLVFYLKIRISFSDGFSPKVCWENAHLEKIFWVKSNHPWQRIRAAKKKKKRFTRLI